MTTTKDPTTTTLSNLVAVSTEWEHEPTPVPEATRRVAWAGTAAAAASAAWLIIGGNWLGNRALDGWPIGGTVVRWTLIPNLRFPVIAAVTALCLAGVFLAWLTRGFTQAGPRLHWVLLGHGGFAALSGILPAAALAALAVTVAVVAVAVVAVLAAAAIAIVIATLATFASAE